MSLGIGISGFFIVFGSMFLFFLWVSGEKTPRKDETIEMCKLTSSDEGALILHVLNEETQGGYKLTARDIVEKVQRQIPTVTDATVIRTVRALVEDGHIECDDGTDNRYYYFLK